MIHFEREVTEPEIIDEMLKMFGSKQIHVDIKTVKCT